MFWSKMGFLSQEALLSGWSANIAGKPQPPVSSDLQPVRHALVLVQVLRLEHEKLFVSNLVHGRGVFISWEYGKRDDMALMIPYPPSSHISRDSSSRPAGVYGNSKCCPSNHAGGSGNCRAASWFIFCCLLFVIRSCVLRIRKMSTRRKICFVSRTPDKCYRSLAVRFTRSYRCYKWNDGDLDL